MRKHLQQPPEKTQTVSPDPKSVQMEATVQIIYATYDKKPYSNYLYVLGKIFSLSLFLFYSLVIISIFLFGYMQANIFPSSKIKQRERQVTQNIV